MIRTLFLVSALISLLSNCGGGGGGESGGSGGSSGGGQGSEPDLDALVQRIVDNNIVPNAVNFAEAADALESEAEAFCLAPSTAGLANVQADWLSAQEAWYHLAAYNFGPLNADLVFPEFTFIDSLRLRGTNYVGTVRSDITELLGDSTTLDADYFSSQTFQNMGLLSIEVLAYETSTDTPSNVASDIVFEFENTPRKCALLIGQSAELARRANLVSSTWQNSYRSDFLNGELDDGSDPIAVLIVSMQSYLDYLHNRNVIERTATVSQENWASIAAAAEEVESYLEGTAQSDGFFDAITENGDANAVTTVRSNLSDLSEAITDNNVNALELAFQRLDGNFKREIPSGLGVELGITFADGD